MHVFKAERSQSTKDVASRKLWHALHAVKEPRIPDTLLDQLLGGRSENGI